MNEKRLKSLKRSTYLKMLLAEAEEQISGTCGQNGHGNVEALLSGKHSKQPIKRY